MFIKKKLKYFTRPKQMSGLSGDFRIVCSSVHTFNIFKQKSASTKQGEKRSAPPGVPQGRI